VGWVALSMLVGDRVKFFALVFGVAFATLLMAQQSSFCIGLLSLSGNFVRDMREVDIWVMRTGTANADTASPMPDTDLYRVRGVQGVAWAMPLFRGGATVRVADGSTQAVAVVGVDDSTLLGSPQTLLQGRFEDLRRSDAIFVNQRAYQALFPDQPQQLGVQLELNDRRAVVAGIVDTSPGFASSNLVFTRYSNATRFVPSGRNTLSFILVRAQEGVAVDRLAQRIAEATGRQALPRLAFVQAAIDDVVRNSGIVPGFAVVVVLGCVVGAVIVALTLSLFVRDNLKALGALKAIGVGNRALLGMVLLQALLAALVGYGLGIGATAWLLEAAGRAVPDFRTFYMPWQVMLGAAAAVLTMTLGAATLSARRVLLTDAASVFR
jgi:putative ABC transport system permease protein